MAIVEEERVRLTARIPAAMLERLEEAAELLGATLNQFVVQSAVHEAERVLERETTIRLSREGAKQVFDLLDNPPKANEQLQRAFALHNELLRGA